MYPGNIFPAIYLTADLVIIFCAPTEYDAPHSVVLLCIVNLCLCFYIGMYNMVGSNISSVFGCIWG